MPKTNGMPSLGHELINVTFEQEVLPAHHRSHGTPDPVVRRWITVEIGASRAAIEQTDYGHPGRFNPPQVRLLSTKLASREAQLKDLVPVLAELAG